MALGELFISAKHDDACPFLKTLCFVHLKANKRVGAQSFDFLADRGKTGDTLIVIGKIAGRNMGCPLFAQARWPKRLAARKSMLAFSVSSSTCIVCLALIQGWPFYKVHFVTLCSRHVFQPVCHLPRDHWDERSPFRLH